MVRTPVGFVRVTAVALALCFAPVSSLAATKAGSPTAKKAVGVAAKKAAGVAAKKAASPAKAAALPIEQRADRLKPGHWVWRPELAPDGLVEIVVSIPLQKAYVYRGGTLIGATTVSTGMPGYDTPTGRFRILQKRETHRSNLYDDAPMPFMQRLTWDGVALHAGAIPGEPASHGCVRLPKTFAAKLYGVTDLGATVLIVEDAPSPEAAYAMVSGRTFETAMGGPEEPVEAEDTLEPGPVPR
jgi:lipoprotein-anchoring transpeptidase ErfK/SrfK